MKRIATSVDGAWIIERDVYRDERGAFMETFSYKGFGQLGINVTWMQGNESVSRRLTLRGLHYQLSRPQAKLCWLSCGEALDVIADIRVGSPTQGAVAIIPLVAGTGRAVFVPRGCAHGFLAMSHEHHTVLQYMVDDYYVPNDQHGIAWDDPTLAISWKTTSPILSEKDRVLPTLQLAREQGLLPQYR